MNDLRNFIRAYSVPALLIVAGAVLVEVGICMWFGWPGALVSLGGLLILIGLMSA